jgi:hypothetical protein
MFRAHVLIFAWGHAVFGEHPSTFLVGQQSRDTAGARRKRMRIKQIGADIRDIDRMMHALRSRLGAQHDHPSN